MPDAKRRRRSSMDHGEARYARVVHHHQQERHLDRRQATSSPHTTRRPASTPTASVVTLSISGRLTTVTLDTGDSPPPAASRNRGSSSTSAAARSRSSVASSPSPVVAASTVNAQASASSTDPRYNPNGGPPRLTTGQTYAVIAGAICLGLIILGMLVFFCYRKRKEKADEKGWWKLQDGQHEDIKDDKDGGSKNGRMMGQWGAGNTGRVSPYRERDQSPHDRDRERLDVDISAPVLQRQPSSNARLGPWSADNGARDLSSGRDTPSRPLRPSQLIAHERQQRDELLAMPTRPSPSASKITQWSNTTMVENSGSRAGLGIDSSPYLVKSSNPATPRTDYSVQDKSMSSLQEEPEYPPTRARMPPARMDSRQDSAQGLAAKTDTIWGLADSYTDRGEVDEMPKYAPRGDSRRPQVADDDGNTHSSFDSTPRGSDSAKGTSESSNTSYADPPSAKPQAAALIPPRLPRSDSIRRPAAQAQSPPRTVVAPTIPPLSSSPPSAINQVRAALQQADLASPTASTIMSAPSPNATLRSPALHVDLCQDEFRLPSDLQELARFASEPSPDLGRTKSPLPFLSDVSLERKASNATLRAADAFAPSSSANASTSRHEPQVRSGTSPLAVGTQRLPYGAQPASASPSIENAPARSPIAPVQAGGRRPDPSAQVHGQDGVRLVRKVSISRDPLGPVRLSREDSLKMRFGGASSPDPRSSPSPLDSSHARSPSTELEEIEGFGVHRQSDAPAGARTVDRDTLGRYDDLFELEAAARSSTSSVPQHDSLFSPLTFDVPQTKPLSFSANTSTAGSGPPTPTTPAFQVNAPSVNAPTVVVAEASPRSDSTVTLHPPPSQTPALRTKNSPALQSAAPSADGFIPLSQMTLQARDPNYRSPVDSVYAYYDT